MTRILVTGAEGQLGRALRVAAVVGTPTADFVEKTAGRDIEWLFTDLAGLDITDAEAVEAFFGRHRPDVVVNAAAFTDVDAAEKDRAAAFRINRDGVRFLAEAARRHGASLIHISTDFVFDGAVHEPYTEEDTPAPLNVYGESKLAGERAVLESGCGGAIVRTSWLYSPWGRNFVRSILAAAAKNTEIRVVSDQWGCPTSAGSLAGAIMRMIPALVAVPRRAELYHFCDAGVVSRSDLAAEIIRQAGLGCRVLPVSSAEYPMAARRPAYSALDTAKITRDFGIAPPPWREELKSVIK